MKVKVLLFFILLTVLPISFVSGIPVRNITSAKLDTYLNGDLGLALEDVFLISPGPGYNLLAKIKWDHTLSNDTVTVTAGTVFDLWKYTYSEISYGVSFSKGTGGESNDHIINGDFYYEREKGLLLGGVKFQFSEVQFTFLPSLAGKYYFTDFFSLWGKYIFIYDTVTNIDHAFWGEGEFRIIPPLSWKAGGTVSSYSPAYREQKAVEWSVLTGLSYSFSPQVTLKYLGEFKKREEYSLIANTLILDLRFQ